MDQKFKYLRNILSKDGLRFSLDPVQLYATAYQQALAMIDIEYSSAVRQNCIKNYLISLSVRELEATALDVSSCLSKLNRLILKLSRQMPQSHGGDAHRSSSYGKQYYHTEGHMTHSPEWQLIVYLPTNYTGSSRHPSSLTKRPN